MPKSKRNVRAGTVDAYLLGYRAGHLSRRAEPGFAAKLAVLAGDWVSSEIARMEALVVPHRMGNAGLIQDFEDFFTNQLVDVVEFTRAVFDQGISIRARFGFKTPDAFHLAAAVESSCDVFMTNDQKLVRFNGIRVEVV